MRLSILLTSMMLCGCAFAGDVLWIAEAVPAAKSAAQEPKLSRYASDVSRALHISNLDLLEEKKRDLVVGESARAKFKSGSLVTLECLARDETRYTVRLNVADKAGAILTTDVHLAKQSPLLIHGPSENGQHLVFILEVR